ncbi:MAG: hypothetical protein HeimC3_17910 [Candidatus Heimdallarchaeota archaeon LC_3]|nr:MAG: hypothetical protein HeimC3_17910 [Candidatus Heimdallarchaeota archaeon LC_3]
MENIVFRDYQISDVQDLKDIILQAENFGPNFLDSELQKNDLFLNNPKFGRIILAIDPLINIILGIARIEFKWRSLVIDSLITHHKYMRKGIGSRLIEKIKEIGENHPKINVIRVNTGDFMIYAQKFYLSCGFRITGHISHDMSWFNNQVHFSYPLKGVEKEEN